MPGHATGSASKPSASAQRSRKPWLRDARIRTKLALILLVPLVAIGALATARLVEGATRAIEADRVRLLVAVSVEAADVAHQLHQERIEAVRLLATRGDAGGFNRRSALADDAVTAYRGSVAQLGQVPAVVAARLAALDDQLVELATLRQQILGDPPVTISAAVLRYGAILAEFGAYQDALSGAIEEPTLSEQTRAVAAMSQATGHAADAEAIGHAAAGAGEITEQQREALRATQTGQQEAFTAFRQAASPAQRAIADRAITGANVDTAETATATLLQDAEAELGPAAAGLAGMVDVTRFVEQQLLDQLLASVTQTRNSVFQRVLVESGLVVLAVTVAILVAVWLARMLARSLHQLRASAVAVAHRELPATVKRLSDPRALAEGGLAAPPQPPQLLASRDEIGEVARALYEVQQVAVRTAAQQAALRTSVSAMFLNLARRSQALVDNMISRLDRLMRNEQDDTKLQQMFVLDNLATRMRRNDENLLVLAGADSSPPRSQDALIDDVLQAAQSEIEHYQRVEFGTIDDDVKVIASAINDVVRLIAELLDNATRFSPPASAVVCEARRLGDQLIVQIEDHGLGMTDDQVTTINTMLTRPTDLDVANFRRMGVAVIARLAARHQIRVQLQAHPHYGTTASVSLPPAILVLPASRQRAFALPAARAPLPVEQPSATAPTTAATPKALPPRSPDVVRHVAGRRLPRTERAPTTAATPPVPASGMPVAGRPIHLTGGYDQPHPSPPTVELPIFREMQAAWFRNHGAGDLTWSDPPAATLPSPAPIVHTGPADLSAAQTTGPAPQSGQPWRTAADGGWAAAAAAATPSHGGATSSGLPKRVPQAQLVPGGVQPAQGSNASAQRRTPEQIRGLLSAYHRGVQRGRARWT